MTVMLQGFSRVKEIVYGAVDAPDRSSMRGESLFPLAECGATCRGRPEAGRPRPSGRPSSGAATFEQRVPRRPRLPPAGLGRSRPRASAAAATGDDGDEVRRAARDARLHRRELHAVHGVHLVLPRHGAAEHGAGPDDGPDDGRARPTCTTRWTGRGSWRACRTSRSASAPGWSRRRRRRPERPSRTSSAPPSTPLGVVSAESKAQLHAILDTLPLAYNKVNAIFANLEKKTPGRRRHLLHLRLRPLQGLRRVRHRVRRPRGAEDGRRDRGAERQAHDGDRLPEPPRPTRRRSTSASTTPSTPQASREAALRNHLMVRSNYDALVSGDGACAGCGEKTRPARRRLGHRGLHAAALPREGRAARAPRPNAARRGGRRAPRGPEGEEPGRVRPLREGRRPPPDGPRRRERRGHRRPPRGARPDHRRARSSTPSAPCSRRTRSTTASCRPIDGRLANGMSVMAMGAHTGCNTVYGSTPPNNPHPYPWMNSLFQDGATIAWLFGEAFIHGPRPPLRHPRAARRRPPRPRRRTC